jgi:hypothetical protein
MRRLLAATLLLLVVVSTSPADAGESTVKPSTASSSGVTPDAAGTISIGAAAGTETSRSFVALDLKAVTGEISGGELTLPIDTASSIDPTSATIDVCAARDAGAATCASPTPATVSADAVTVDLGPFVAALRDGGLALAPSVSAMTATSTWRVVITAAEISATITTVDDEQTATSVTTTPPEPPPVFSAPGSELSSPAPFALSPPPVRRAPVVARPQLSRAPSLVATAATPASTHRYADSLVFVLPLVLLAIAAYFGSALTKPIDLQRGRRRARPAPAPPATD